MKAICPWALQPHLTRAGRRGASVLAGALLLGGTPILGALLVLAVTFPLAAAQPQAVLATPPQVVPFQTTFQQVAGARWIDRAAQGLTESGGSRHGVFYLEPQAVSEVGARGITQFMPGTWSWCEGRGWIPLGSSPFDPVPAIQAQHQYMLWLEARAGGFDQSLASYNAGLGNIFKAQRIATTLGMRDSAAWLRTLPQVTHQNAQQTIDYVARNATFRAGIRAKGGTP